jgi:hypothetical protein
MKGLKQNSLLFILFALLGLPLFYYAYKFGTPEFGGLDVYSYYKLYANWDFASVDSPFNQRILSSYAIYLIHQTGISYNTETAITALGLDKQVYFSALLFNYVCVVLTCIVIYRTVERFLKADVLYSFASAMVFMLGFGTLFFLITALTDALSVLFVALIFRYYLDKSWLLIPVLLASVFQREYIFFVFGLMALIHWITEKPERKYYMIVLGVNIACFLLYYICRKTIFYTPRFDHQIDFGKFWHTIQNSFGDMKAYLRQVVMIQNLLIIYVGVCIYKYWKKIPFDKVYFSVTMLLFLEIVVLSVIIGLGNNTGRYFYMTAPILVFLLAKEWLPLLKRNSQTETAG